MEFGEIREISKIKTLPKEKVFLDDFLKDKRKKWKIPFFEIERVIPEKLKSKTPILIVPGWQENASILENFLENISRLGRKTFCLTHPPFLKNRKKIEYFKNLQRAFIKIEFKSVEKDMKFSKYFEYELYKAYVLFITIEKILKEEKKDKIDIIAHSEGAINVIIAALLKPERFRNIILAAPAGIIENDNFLRLAIGFSQRLLRLGLEKQKKLLMAGKRKIKIKKKEILKEVFKHILKNPLEAIKEGLAISDSQIYPGLEELAKEGIKIAIIYGKNDPVFPAKKIDKIKKILRNIPNINFYPTKGGHDEIIFEKVSFPLKIDEIFKDLEENN